MGRNGISPNPDSKKVFEASCSRADSKPDKDQITLKKKEIIDWMPKRGIPIDFLSQFA